MANLAQIALEPFAAAEPGFFRRDLADSPTRRAPDIIGGTHELFGCSCRVGAEDVSTATLQITPTARATVRYSIVGTHVRGEVIVQVNGWTHRMPFDVDASGVVRKLAQAHARAHGQDTIGGFFDFITKPIASVVNAGKNLVEGAANTARGLLPDAAKKLVDGAMRTAKGLVKGALKVWHGAAKWIATVAKNKALEIVKSIVRSPITAGILTGVAIAFPIVGAPALAALAAANTVLAVTDAAVATVSAYDSAVSKAEKLVGINTPAAKAELAKIKTLLAKEGPRVAKLKLAHAQAVSGIANLTTRAKKGDKMAKLHLSILSATGRAQDKLKRTAVTAALHTHNPKTPAERQKVIALALKKYVPSASAAIMRYHPKLGPALAAAQLDVKRAPAPVFVPKKVAAARKPAPVKHK